MQKYIALARELTGTQAKIAEKDEEIQELKSERTNTRVGGSREGTMAAVVMATPLVH